MTSPAPSENGPPRRLEDLAALLHRVGMAANLAPTFEAAVQATLEAICEWTGWPLGHAYLAADNGKTWRPSGIWSCAEPAHYATFRQVTEATTLSAGRGLPGQVAAARGPVWITDLAEEDNFPRWGLAANLGVRAAFGLPVFVGHDVVAVLEFFAPEVRAPDRALLDTLTEVAAHLGRVEERCRGAAALADSGARTRAIIDSAGDAFVEIDTGGRVTDWNRRAEAMFGWTAAEVTGRLLTDTIIPEQFHDAHRDGIARYLATGEGPVFHRPVELVARRRSGEELPIELTIWPLRVGGETRFNAFIRDIADRRRAEEELRCSEAGFRLLFERNPQPMLVYDEQTMRFLEVNAAALAAYGYSRDEFLAMTVPDLHPPEEAGRVPDVIAGRPADLHGGQWRHRLKDGTVIEVAITSHRMPFAGRPAVLVLARDVTAERALETRLRHQALHDPLTGLANRQLFSDRVDHALARSRRDGATHAVLFLDLDTFKAVNDTLGHVTGDRVLVEFAERLRASLRTGDTAARLGGDEFAVLLEEVSEAEATGVAGRFLEVFSHPVRVEGREVVLTASLGIALSEPDQGVDDLLRNADLAMYEAKRRGRNRWAVFAADLHDAARRRFELVADLRAALEREELSLQYQPVVTLPEGRIVGIEALARWRHPERGPVSPAEFIPLAEESGLIHPLGRWVLHTACRDFSRWAARYPAAGHLSVNVSTRQLDDGFVAEVAAALEAAGLEGRRLVLEITESLFIGDVTTTVARLQRLKGLGVRLAMDDFGTGYSSLSYLRDLPLDILKIDKAFVDVVSYGPEKAAVARAVVKLARTFGLWAVAEGVETAEQVEALVALGCAFAQGYWFSPPLDPAALETRLAAEPAPAPVGDHRR